MLKSLYIKNFAIIDELQLDFENGLNIFTGETGAGKSIIIDAMLLAFGERASNDVVRNGANKAIIECVFDISSLTSKIDIDDISEFSDGTELILRREIPTKGNSRCFLNDTPVSANKLREISDLLVDFHGQHEHQTLLKNSEQLKILDEFANNQNLIKSYQEHLKELNELLQKLFEINSQRDEIFSKRDDLKEKLNLINQINPLPNEEEEINTKLKTIENAEFLSSMANELYSIIYDGEISCYNQLNRAKKLLETLVKYEKNFADFENELNSITVSLKEFSSFVKDFLDNIEFNPLEIEHLRERYSELKKLIRLFGSLEEAIQAKENLFEQLELIERYDEKILELKQKIYQKAITLGELAEKIERNRKEKAEILSKEIVEKLKNLGIDKAKFDIKFEKYLIENENLLYEIPSVIIDSKIYKAYSNGISLCEFLVSTNPGYDVQPLKNVASGGEISRIMLAIKSIVAKEDNIPLLIFDEIDTGISGKIAQKVAFELKNLSKYHQIIAITHLPQVAAAGIKNFVVEKLNLMDNTFVNVKSLSEDEKIIEIAKLLSGEQITESSLNNAKDLIKAVSSYE